MKEDIWRITEDNQFWVKKWIRYNADGKSVGAMIIVVNGSLEFIEAIQKAFDETEGQKAR